MHDNPLQARSRTESDGIPVTGPAEDAQRVSILDSFGQRREGFLLKAVRWDESVAAALDDIKGDFRIVILSEQPEGPVHPPPRTVVCAPASAPKGRATVQEAVTPYDHQTKAPRQSLTTTETQLLARGRLHAATELRITPDQVFGSGKPRLELLAQDLLTCEALASYLNPLAVALSAPHAPARASTQELMAVLRLLFKDAEAALQELGRDVGPEATLALKRLAALSTTKDVESFLAEAHHLYPKVPDLLEDVYLLRALKEKLPEALEVLTMRAFIAEADVPLMDHDLARDKEIAKEHARFANLVAEPHSFDAARAALDHFRRSYNKRYESHHWVYWTEAVRLHGRLLDVEGLAEALRKLNTLRELGPPVGEGALSTYRDLLDRTSGCPLAAGIEDQLNEAAACPACGLRLDQQPPTQRVSETLQRIERSIERQLARLSSVAVRQVLEGSGDPRVERFLKVIQAAQLASLPEILDDDLVGYLRRFLVEARIDTVLGPVLSRLEQGTAPRSEEAQEALRELARVLDRAFRASARALPPPRAALNSRASKKTKK